jgi:NADH:ubiquinone reductase (H+-translocating)
MSSSATAPRHSVVIVGCGFGGLSAAKTLKHADVDVTVIDRTNHHLVQPLLHQVATGILSEGDVALPIRGVLHRQTNTTVLLGEVTAFDLQARTVTVETNGQSRSVGYDSLIVAAGAAPSYFGHPEYARNAPAMKTIDEALELRGRIFAAFEMAEAESDDAARRRCLTFVVVGGGPTGVELAGQLAELSRHSLRGNFRHIDPAEARVVVLEGAPTILPTFPAALRERATRDLEDLGVEVYVGTRVISIDDLGVDTDATKPWVRRINARTKIWAAGVKASWLARALADAAHAELDRNDRVNVEPDCTLPGYPEVFVIGDLMSLDGLPGVTQVAIQSGRHAADTIVRRLAGDTARRRFAYHEMGSLAMISRLRAVAVVGRLRLAGAPAWMLWLTVRLMALTGFRARVFVFFNWVAAFLAWSRAQRIMTWRPLFSSPPSE